MSDNSIEYSWVISAVINVKIVIITRLMFFAEHAAYIAGSDPLDLGFV